MAGDTEGVERCLLCSGGTLIVALEPRGGPVATAGGLIPLEAGLEGPSLGLNMCGHL